MIAEDFKRVWPTGALLALGDALTAENYFDHAPILEMVYHLRNGIAHGNRFEIRKVQRLQQYPAHNRGAQIAGKGTRVFGITPDLNGQEVLFSYMESGDVQDLLMSVGGHLRHLATPQRQP
jgi:hypothetical protein